MPVLQIKMVHMNFPFVDDRGSGNWCVSQNVAIFAFPKISSKAMPHNNLQASAQIEKQPRINNIHIKQTQQSQH